MSFCGPGRHFLTQKGKPCTSHSLLFLLYLHMPPSSEPRPFQPSTWKYTKIRDVLARKRGFSHSRPRVGELSVKGQTVLIFSWAGLYVCCSYSMLPFQCEINYRQYENRCDCALKNFIYKNKQALAPHFYLPAQIKIPTRGME